MGLTIYNAPHGEVIVCSTCAKKYDLTEADISELGPFKGEAYCTGCGVTEAYIEGIEKADQGEGAVPARQIYAFGEHIVHLTYLWGRNAKECSLAQRALSMAIFCVNDMTDPEMGLDMLSKLSNKDEMIDFLDPDQYPGQEMNGQTLHQLAHHIFNAAYLLGFDAGADGRDDELDPIDADAPLPGIVRMIDEDLTDEEIHDLLDNVFGQEDDDDDA